MVLCLQGDKPDWYEMFQNEADRQERDSLLTEMVHQKSSVHFMEDHYFSLLGVTRLSLSEWLEMVWNQHSNAHDSDKHLGLSIKHHEQIAQIAKPSVAQLFEDININASDERFMHACSPRELSPCLACHMHVFWI